MFITEQNTQMWSKMLKENFNVSDEKLGWVAEYAAIHSVYESAMGIQGTPAAGQAVIPSQGVGPMYATPLNTIGMGNPAAPSQPSTTSTAPGNFWNQNPGSGDIPVSTLPMALNVALMTIGLELVPVIPSKGPWVMLTYMDFPYAGGKVGGKNTVAGVDGIGEGRENKPLYFKVLLDAELIAKDIKGKVAENDKVEFISGTKSAVGYFKAFGRMDGGVIAEVKEVTADSGSYNTSLADVFSTGLSAIKVNDVELEYSVADAASKLALAKVDYAQTQVDFIDGFANFATGKKEAMTRAQNETGTGNTIGLRLFSKWIEMGSYEVTGTVTRQQLQDLPLYGVDAVSKVMEAMQNELTQHINARILERAFALGVTNALNLKFTQGADLNLHMGKSDTTMAATSAANFTDIYGVDHKATWGTIKNAEVNTSAENLHTRQRRIASRIQAAANMIAVTGRRGRGNIVVTNAQVATALQDCSGYVVAPVENTLSQSQQNLYKAGSLAGLQIYVDPYMAWEDTRVCVMRKGTGNEPGLVFLPYIIGDSCSITAEGTMSAKMLINSRFALAEIGFFPESQFITFVVDSPEFGII